MRKKKDTHSFDFRPLGLAIREARELYLIHISVFLGDGAMIYLFCAAITDIGRLIQSFALFLHKIQMCIRDSQKHLSLEDRIYIENELNKGETFKNIARFLCKDPTTISKEVRAHRLSDWYHKGTFYNAHNFCIHRFHCRKTNVCGKIILCDVK